MKYVSYALTVCLSVAFCSPLAAQESPKTEITVRISDATPSFKNQRLVVMLHHTNPLQPDRGPTAVDRHVDAAFSHEQGTETVLTITLGEKAQLKRGVQYFVNVSVFDGGRITHVTERNGRTGPVDVPAGDGSFKIALSLRPAP
jgi:hypothetical protein